MSAPVFITHSSRDYKRSRSVVDVLEKNGLRCWISERDIGAGDNYGDAIVDAIENAKVMVLIFSANANSSDEIKKEIALASQRKLTVVPIRIEDAAPSKAFRYELITRNWIDCFPDWHRGMATLVQRVSSIVNETSISGETPRAPSKPKAAVPTHWIAASVAGALMIGAAAAYGLWPRPTPVNVAHHNDAPVAVPPAAPAAVTIQPEKPAAATAPAASHSPAPDIGPKSAPTTSAAAAQEPPSTKPTEAKGEPTPSPNAVEPKAAPTPSEAHTAATEPNSTEPKAASSGVPGRSLESAPTPAAPSATAKPAPALAEAKPKPPAPSTPDVIANPARAPSKANQKPPKLSAADTLPAPTIAKPKPAPVIEKPAPAPPSKKTQIAALGPVPVQAITPPAHPQVPPISSKPPPYNVSTRGGQVFQECKDCPQMVVVPRGSAILGSPQGQPGRSSNEASPHSVTIDKPFAMGRYAVTFDEWDACVTDGGCNGYKPDDNGFGRGKHPVIFVSWNDANAYVAWLKKKTGQPYRLPSESEWEYAARGCTDTQCPDTPFWFGDISPDLANYDSRYSYEGSPKAERELETMPVDQGKPNPFGLYNMLGNVQQWVEDCWNADPSSAATDGSPLLTGDCGDRAIRGGSYSDKPSALRAAARAWDAADDRESPNIGFRVVRTLAP